MSDELPELGAVFWPVGTGDSTTIVVREDVIVQVDLNDRDKADDDENPEVPVVDLLVEALPKVGGTPFLSAFVLTHADKDHCSGFADLNSRAVIGELWATPRLWREYLDDPDAEELCEDAKAFHKEVKRRVAAIEKAVAAGDPVADGDRVLVVGYDTEQSDHAYSHLPDEYLVYPGQSVTRINGDDYAGRFEAFIHAPFKDDCAAARNDTSLSMQVTLTEDGGQDGKVLLFGDLAYETIMKIFNYSEDRDREEYVAFDLLLAPHHCSKYVMYVREGGKDVLKTDVLKAFARHARTDAAVVVASSAVIPSVDKAGANPPHRKAADRYEDYVGPVLCTMEWPSVEDPSPVVFGVDASGARLVEDQVVELAAKTAAGVAVGPRRRLSEVAAAATAAGRFAAGRLTLAETTALTGTERVRAAVAADRGAEQAPTTAVGFGCG